MGLLTLLTVVLRRFQSLVVFSVHLCRFSSAMAPETATLPPTSPQIAMSSQLSGLHPHGLVPYLAVTNLISGMGMILSAELIATTAYFLLKSRQGLKIIFVKLCLAALLLTASMVVFVAIVSRGLHRPGNADGVKRATAAAYFMVFGKWQSVPYDSSLGSQELTTKPARSRNVALRLHQRPPTRPDLCQWTSAGHAALECLGLHRGPRPAQSASTGRGRVRRLLCHGPSCARTAHLALS